MANPTWCRTATPALAEPSRRCWPIRPGIGQLICQHDDAGVMEPRSEPGSVEPSEVANVTRVKRPQFQSRESELILIGKPSSANLGRGDDVQTHGPQGAYEGTVHGIL